MDPLSVTASIIGISEACLSVSKALNDFRGKYHQADLTISAICAETAVVNASLAHIQSFLYKDGDVLVARFKERPDLASVFDTSCISCMMLYSCLEAEIGNLRIAASEGGGLEWKQNMKAAWKEDTMKGLLQQIRGQETALNLLLQSLQMQSITDLRTLLQDQSATIEHIQQDTKRLRKLYPDSEVPESIFETNRAPESIFGDSASGIGTAEFSFDDLIVNSKAYRRILGIAQEQISKGRQTVSPNLRSDQEPTSQTLDHESAATISYLRGVDQRRENNKATSNLFASPTVSHKEATSQEDDSSKTRLFNHDLGLLDPNSRLRHDWAIAFNLNTSDLKGKSNIQVGAQSIWWEVLQRTAACILSADAALRFFCNLLTSFRPSIQTSQAVDLSRFAQNCVRIFEDLIMSTTEHLFNPLLSLWESHGAWTPVDTSLFISFCERAGAAYTEYARELPSITIRISAEAKADKDFKQALDLVQVYRQSERFDLFHHLRTPIRTIEIILLTSEALCRSGEHSPDEQARTTLSQAKDAIQSLSHACDQVLDESFRKAKIEQIASKFISPAVQAELLKPDRKLF